MTDERQLTAHQLQLKYDTDEGWGQHPRFPCSDWRHEVAEEYTRLGYWQWVEDQLAQEEN